MWVNIYQFHCLLQVKIAQLPDRKLQMNLQLHFQVSIKIDKFAISIHRWGFKWVLNWEIFIFMECLHITSTIYMIQFITYLRQAGCSPQSMNLTDTMKLEYCWKWCYTPKTYATSFYRLIHFSVQQNGLINDKQSYLCSFCLTRQMRPC